jgi:hypothetical protein
MLRAMCVSEQAGRGRSAPVGPLWIIFGVRVQDGVLGEGVRECMMTFRVVIDR